MIQTSSGSFPHMEQPLEPSPGRDINRIEATIVDLARTQPELGQLKVAEELARRGLRVSASGVRQIWQRHDLETTYKRLKALVGSKATALAELSPRQHRLLERGQVGAKAKRRLHRANPEAGGNDRRLQILSAAADCFAREGFARTSLRDIAGRIGVLPGSIYHFFRTKDALFLSVHEQGFEELIANVQAAISRARSPWTRLEAACREHVRALVEGNTILRLTGASFFSSYEPELTARLAPDRRRYDEIFKRLVNDLDLPREVDRTLFRLFILGAINWAYVWYRDGKRSPEEIARELVANLRNAR